MIQTYRVFTDGSAIGKPLVILRQHDLKRVFMQNQQRTLGLRCGVGLSARTKCHQLSGTLVTLTLNA